MIRFLRNIVLALAFVFVAVTAANATCGTGSGTCFVVPAGGAWTSGTFSSTSGGASCACTPAAGDALILDSLAGNLTSVNGNPSLASLDASGTGGSGSPYTGTFTHTNSQTVTITGNLFKLSAGMTYVVGGTNSNFTFTSTTGTTVITTAGQTLPQLTFNGVGGTFRFADNLTNNGTAFTLTNGTVDAATNNVNVSVGNVSSNNANTRTLSCGTGTWTLTPAVSINLWDFSTSTNATVNCSSASIVAVMTNVNASAGTSMNLGSCATCTTLGSLSVGALTNGPRGFSIVTTTATTIGTLNITAPNDFNFPNTTTTITNAITWAGTSSNQIYVGWSSSGGTGSSNVAFGTNSTVSWVAWRGIHNTGAGTITSNSSFNLGGNSGITINAPSGGGGFVGIIGGN